MRHDDFAARYFALVDVRKLADLPIDVIGCGTIGKPLAAMLAAMGADNLHLWDSDTVNGENMGNQGWMPGELGLPKVEALANMCRLYGSKPVPHNERVVRVSPLVGTVRFYCVDSVDARRDIAAVTGAELHVDGRIGGEKCQIVCRPTGEELAKTVPEANGPAACGTQSTLFIGHVCAGLMVSQFTRWLRGEQPHDVFQSPGTGAGAWRYVE